MAGETADAVKDMGVISVGGERDSDRLPPPVNTEPLKREETFKRVNVGADETYSFTVPPSRRYPRGCIVKVREPVGSAQFRAMMMLPADKSNPQLVSTIQSILYVVEIDGKAKAPPQTLLQAQGIADELGDEGIMALNLALMEAFPVDQELRDRSRKIMETQNL